jgi:transposase-like protein
MTTSQIPKTRRHFDPAYKLQVAKMIREQGLSVSQVCKDMDLTTSAVHRWLQQYDAELAGRCGIGKLLWFNEIGHGDKARSPTPKPST